MQRNSDSSRATHSSDSLFSRLLFSHPLLSSSYPPLFPHIIIPGYISMIQTLTLPVILSLFFHPVIIFNRRVPRNNKTRSSSLFSIQFLSFSFYFTFFLFRSLSTILFVPTTRTRGKRREISYHHPRHQSCFSLSLSSRINSFILYHLVKFHPLSFLLHLPIHSILLHIQSIRSFNLSSLMTGSLCDCVIVPGRAGNRTRKRVLTSSGKGKKCLIAR